MKKIVIAFVLISFYSIPGWAQKKKIVLFDGTNLSQWHTFKKSDVSGWTIENGVLTTDGKGGDLVTNKEFKDFILELDYKILPKSNSGIVYKVIESDDKAFFATYASGPEFQIIDDKGYPAELKESQKSGANYDIHAPKVLSSKAPGEWNHVTIKVKGEKITHTLNGKKVVSYSYGTPQWQAEVAKSKFAQWPYAKAHDAGKIALQGHNDPVYFKNIVIKEL